MKTRHFGQLLALSALWGASFLFIRIAAPVLGPWVLAALRVGLATLTLAVLMLGACAAEGVEAKRAKTEDRAVLPTSPGLPPGRRRWYRRRPVCRVLQPTPLLPRRLLALRHAWPWRHWRTLLVIGLLSVALPFMLYAWAALRLPAGYSALLNTTAVLFGTLASAWFKEDTLSARKLIGCAVGFVGVGLIVRLGPVPLDAATLAAALACVTAAACYGLSTPLMKRATTQMQPLAIAAGIHLPSLLVVLPGAVWTLPRARLEPGALAAVAGLGVITSGLAYWAHLRIIRHVSPVTAMSPAFLIPVFGVTDPAP